MSNNASTFWGVDLIQMWWRRGHIIPKQISLRSRTQGLTNHVPAKANIKFTSMNCTYSGLSKGRLYSALCRTLLVHSKLGRKIKEIVGVGACAPEELYF